jgi:expansin
MRGLAWFAGAVLLGNVIACSGNDGAKGAGTANTSGGGSGTESGGSGNGGTGSPNTGSGGTNSGSGGTKAASGGATATTTTPGASFGQVYEEGQFNLGPVDYSESQWHNACAPGTKYAPSVQAAEGGLLAGLWNGIPNTASYCDACILVKTAKGKSAVLRVVTYGDTSKNSIDVSQSAYDILNTGEYPRSMTWQFTECPDTGKLIYEFQTGSSEYWTSLWVRNARVPLTKVEVKSANHKDFITLARGSDGTLTDASGFGKGPMTFRLTGMDGKQYTEDLAWPAAGVAGATLTGAGNID